jgi:hypothetical protein
MGTAQIWHYRDHDHGGYFDGSGYLNCGASPATVSARLVPVKCRFRYDEIPSTMDERSVWGFSGDTGEYSLSIVHTTEGDYPRVRYLNMAENFTELTLYPGTIYGIEVSVTAASTLRLFMVDQWGAPMYEEEISCSGASGSLPMASMFIGGCSKDGLTLLRPFVGTVFDFFYHNGTDYRHLVFRKNHEGVGDTVVKDRFGHQNGVLSGMPSFWPVARNISNRVVDVQDIRVETDSQRVRSFSAFHFDVVNESAIQTNDTIVIRDNDDHVTGVYQVEKVETKSYGLLRVHCQDMLKDLDRVPASRIVSLGNSTDITRDDWWNLAVPVTYTGQTGGQYADVEYNFDLHNPEDCWYSVLYLFRHFIGYLQLERLVQVDTSDLTDRACPYTINGTGRAYRWLAVNAYRIQQAGRTARANENGANCAELFREILFVLRVTYVLNDGDLIFTPIRHEAFSIDSRYVFEESITREAQHKHYQLNQSRLGTATPWNDDWTEDDVTDITCNQVAPGYTLLDQVNDLTLTAQFLLQHHNTVNNTLLDFSPDYLEQLVTRLDREFVGDFRFRTVKTALSISDHAAYVRKSNSLEKLTSDLTFEL